MQKPVGQGSSVEQTAISWYDRDSTKGGKPHEGSAHYPAEYSVLGRTAFRYGWRGVRSAEGRKESQNTFFLKLYLAITINALINFALFYLFADFFSVNLIRTLFTVIMLYLVLRLMVRDTRMNTLFAVLFHVLCLVACIVEVVRRQGAAHAGGVGGVQNLEVGLEVGLHLVAGLKNNVALRQGLLGQRSLGDNAVLLAEGCGALEVRVCGLDAGGIAIHEGGKSLRVVLNGILADDQNAGDQLGAGDLLPFLVHVKRNAQTLDLGHGAGDEGLRQHGDGGFARLDLAQGLGGLAAILDGNVAVGVNAVLGQDVAQNVLGGSALAGGDDGLALQIPDRVDGLSVLDDVEHAQRVDAGNFHCTVRLVVERGGEVGGYSGGVQVSLDQQRHDFIGSAVHHEVVVGGDLIAHQVDETHRRGALQARDAQGVGGGKLLCGFAGSSLGGSGLTGGCRAGNGGACAAAAGQILLHIMHPRTG